MHSTPLLRRPKRTVYFGLMLVCLLAARTCYDGLRDALPPARELTLKEGHYRILSVVDPVTFICIPCDHGATQPPRMRVRLAGVRLCQRAEPPPHRDQLELAIRTTVELIRGRPVRLRFDRHRHDDENSVLAYAFADDVFLNLRLCELGICENAAVPGNSVSIQRQLRRATRRYQRTR